MKSDTPITVAAIKRLAQWEIRADAAAKRGSHLDSDDPQPPGGFEVAEKLERAANALADALRSFRNWPDAKKALSAWDELKKGQE